MIIEIYTLFHLSNERLSVNESLKSERERDIVLLSHKCLIDHRTGVLAEDIGETRKACFSCENSVTTRSLRHYPLNGDDPFH